MRSLHVSLICGVAFFLAGCGGAENQKVDVKSERGDLHTPPDGRGMAKKIPAAGSPDRDGGEAKSASPLAPEDKLSALGGSTMADRASASAGLDAVKPATVEAMVGTDKPRTLSQRGPQAGILTAGSFDDNLNPDFFRRFTHVVQQNPQVPGLADRVRGQSLVIAVRGDGDAPVGNARVRASAGQGGNGIELTTRSDGRVVFLPSFDALPEDGSLTVTVTPPGGGNAVSQSVPVKSGRWDVSLPGVKPRLPRNLDLVLVLDTTGSMGKELDYLKSEWKSIATAIHDKFPEVNQRYGLVLYRDEGDEYVTRPFPFTMSIEEFRKNLAAQRATGGGDEPEALHRGLEEATQYSWRGDDTARVLFLVTDAPPHAQFVGRSMEALNVLRKQGVAVYGVKTGNPSDAAELVLRSCSLLTGSEYVFLTDDSGVGNAHGEPHIPFYYVQKLDKMMARMVEGELRGRRIIPATEEVLRTVGKPIN
jgi:hypothetical protein